MIDTTLPMAEIVLFHHAQGLTDGVRALADAYRAAGHVVHVPDLYEGRTFGSVAEGVSHAQEVGFGTIIGRGAAAIDGLSESLVFAGLSLGVLPAQYLVQTRAGARGALLLHGCVPPSEFGGEWPAAVPVQIHLMENDAEVLPPNADLEAARELDATVEAAELFLYPGDRHLFTDRTLDDYDEDATRLVTERALAFLEHLA
jgi:dienelactone hydrolase